MWKILIGTIALGADSESPGRLPIPKAVVEESFEGAKTAAFEGVSVRKHTKNAHLLCSLADALKSGLVETLSEANLKSNNPTRSKHSLGHFR